MTYKDCKWDVFTTSYLRTFGTQVPVYSPSVYREFRGEIFTTFHSDKHPVMEKFDSNVSIHGRFSKSYQGVLRGLHYDNKTHKLVQAVVGDIYLVVLDVRPNSNTYGKWENFIISESNREQVFVPAGFANGHYALTECMFHYNLFYQGDYIDAQDQGVIKWNDPTFNIEWPSKSPILQWRDR